MPHVKAIPGYAAPYHWAGFALIGDLYKKYQGPAV